MDVQPEHSYLYHIEMVIADFAVPRAGAMPFSKGRALLKKEGQMSYIDKTGNIVTNGKE